MFLVGCLGAQEPRPLISADSSTGQFVLKGSLDTASITPGTLATAAFTLRNTGAPATYVTGGCGSKPWTFEIVAPNGTLVGPVAPDPRCLGPPDAVRSLLTGGTLDHSLGWDGFRKWRDEQGEVQRAEAEPGVYALRATVRVERAGVTVEPELELRLRVE